MTDEILYDVADGIGTITLNRPQARNALTFAMYEGLAKICSDPASHGAPKVIVMTGAGEKAFAAGTDITQFRDFKTAEDALAYENRIEKVITAIESCSVPTIAAISGAVTGGGLPAPHRNRLQRGEHLKIGYAQFGAHPAQRGRQRAGAGIDRVVVDGRRADHQGGA